MNLGKKELIIYLQKNKILLSKKRGQNFLIDNNIQKKIVAQLQLTNTDEVVEIGPGFGALTHLIFQQIKNFKVIEIDKKICAFLKNEYKELEIINKDFLKLQDYSIFSKNCKIISNLPYSTATKIILKIIENLDFSLAVFMIQKEVIERLLAKYKNSKYNHLSVLLNVTSNITYLFDVRPSSFYPEPEVNSSVFVLKKKKDFNFKNFNLLSSFLHNCFAHRNKTIYNNLKKFFKVDIIKRVLQNNKLNFNIRPHEITSELFWKLFVDFYEI